MEMHLHKCRAGKSTKPALVEQKRNKVVYVVRERRFEPRRVEDEREDGET